MGRYNGYDAMVDGMAYSLCHVVDYFLKHIYKEPCMTSYMTGEKWVNELLHGMRNDALICLE